MRAGLRGIGVIATATLIEAIRNRLLLVATAFVVILIGLSVSAASVSFGEQTRLIVDVGLASASAIGSVIAIALTVSSIAGELRRRTAYPLLARPVPRWSFVAGKYLGLVAAMELVVGIMILATAGVVALFGGAVPTALWGQLLLTGVEMALVVAVTLLFSTLAVPALAATYAAGMLLAGNLANDILAVGTRLSGEGRLLGTVLKAAYFLLPDLESLSLRTQAANNLPIPASYLLLGAAYGVAYAGVVLLMAAWVFGRRRTL